MKAIPSRMTRLCGAALIGSGLTVVGTVPSQAETTLRVAMTASDIPDYIGQPDQGLEGFRFVGFQLYEGLIGWDLSSADKESVLRPALATGWSVDRSDPKKWVFDLREGVKFHDGCAWNADVAIWNLDRLMKEGVPQFQPVNYARARSRTSAIASYEKLGDYAIAIHTKEPNALFPYLVPYILMISECVYEAAGNDYAAYGKAPSGTGPYRFVNAVPRERLELAKNTEYWDEARIPKQDKLVLIPMPESTTRAAALLSGQVDFIEAPSPDTIPRLQSSGMNVITGFYPHTWSYVLNFESGPFSKLEIRQAANYAIDRSEMTALLDPIAEESYGWFLPSVSFRGDPVKYEYDPEKATALLKEAGCHPCEITVAMSTSGSGQMQPLPMNELVKSQLEAVGFKVNFDVMDWSGMVDIFLKGAHANPRYNAINYSLAVLDPLTGFLNHVRSSTRSPAGTNWGGYSNPEVDKLAEQALATFDQEEQIKLIQQIHELVVADAGRVFIVHDRNPRALSPKVKGFIQAQSYFVDLTQVTME